MAVLWWCYGSVLGNPFFAPSQPSPSLLAPTGVHPLQSLRPQCFFRTWTIWAKKLSRFLLTARPPPEILLKHGQDHDQRSTGFQQPPAHHRSHHNIRPSAPSQPSPLLFTPQPSAQRWRLGVRIGGALVMKISRWRSSAHPIRTIRAHPIVKCVANHSRLESSGWCTCTRTTGSA
jgi:hypothetical protein